MPDPHAVTRLLDRWRAGEPSALDELMPLVYDELRRQAVGMMRAERADHTLQATALIHEAYLRLSGSKLEAENRAHFVALAARVMRRVLVDHARTRGRDKRGCGAERVTLVETMAVVPNAPDRLLDIDRTLERLRALDPRKHEVLELKLFGGLTDAEIAQALGLSVPTVERDLRTARAWLRAELDRPEAS
jgi:RNA polymerase sigma-70 factor, ECF subfamily